MAAILSQSDETLLLLHWGRYFEINGNIFKYIFLCRENFCLLDVYLTN